MRQRIRAARTLNSALSSGDGRSVDAVASATAQGVIHNREWNRRKAQRCQSDPVLADKGNDREKATAFCSVPIAVVSGFLRTGRSVIYDVVGMHMKCADGMVMNFVTGGLHQSEIVSQAMCNGVVAGKGERRGGRHNAKRIDNGHRDGRCSAKALGGCGEH